LTISVSVDDERAWTEVLIPNGQRSSVQMAEGRKGALLGTNRPGVELAQRIVALHGGSVSVGMHERGQVVAIALPID
jgi:predicted ATP-grasp superfamily ATP-dependent carboligase